MRHGDSATASIPMFPPLTHTMISTNGVRLHVVQAGNPTAPLVLLLHGFPDFWLGWRHQIAPLVNAGFRVWIPDQRGYNLSDKPSAIKEYRLDKLADDIIGLIDAAGAEQATVIGHDWGAAVAWRVAQQAPQRVRKLVVMNVPHDKVMRRFLWRDGDQRRRSWYMFFFLLPFLPEFFSRLGNWKSTIEAIAKLGSPSSFASEDWMQYRTAWSQPRAFRSMINWYRAVFLHSPPRVPSSRITMPTLLLWGMQDAALKSEMAQASIQLCDDGRLVMFPQASHWVQRDAVDEVNQQVLQFLGSPAFS